MVSGVAGSWTCLLFTLFYNFLLVGARNLCDVLAESSRFVWHSLYGSLMSFWLLPSDIWGASVHPQTWPFPGSSFLVLVPCQVCSLSSVLPLSDGYFSLKRGFVRLFVWSSPRCGRMSQSFWKIPKSPSCHMTLTITHCCCKGQGKMLFWQRKSSQVIKILGIYYVF